MAKAKSTTALGPVDKKKNSKGQSFKTIWPHEDAADDGGDSDTHKVTRKMTKGMRPGTGRPAPSKCQPAPYAERNKQKRSYKTVTGWVAGKVTM
jgi:hypothetical protein